MPGGRHGNLLCTGSVDFLFRVLLAFCLVEVGSVDFLFIVLLAVFLVEVFIGAIFSL